MDLSPIKQIPIIEIAMRLGIQVRGTKAMCFMGHDKASPSLSFLKSRNTWRCFGSCGKHGDGITLVMEKEGLDFQSALEWFELNYGVVVKRQFHGQRKRSRLLKPKKTVVVVAPPQNTEFITDIELYTSFIEKCEFVTSPTGTKYLDSHGISPEAARRLNLRQLSKPEHALRWLVETWGEQRVYRSGIAWGNGGCPERLLWSSYALLFPFSDNGKIVYIQGRMFKGDRKFLNLRGVTKPIFNSDSLKGLPAGETVHICEGVPDAIALESNGLVAVGVLGATSFSADFVDHFLKFKVIVLGDGDEAGAKFAKDISKYFMVRGKPVHCMLLPKGRDVSDVLAQGGGTK